MTNSKMLEYAHEILNSIHRDSIYSSNTVTIVDHLISDLEEDVRDEINKKSGSTKRASLLKKLVKGIAKTKPAFAYAHPCPNNQWGFLDNARLYILNDKYGYDSINDHPTDGSPVDIMELKDRITNWARERKEVEAHIDLNLLKFKIAAQKAAKVSRATYVIKTDDYMVGFNPQFLLELCEMFKTDTIILQGENCPTYIIGQNGEWGGLCPIRLESNHPTYDQTYNLMK